MPIYNPFLPFLLPVSLFFFPPLLPGHDSDVFCLPGLASLSHTLSLDLLHIIPTPPSIARQLDMSSNPSSIPQISSIAASPTPPDDPARSAYFASHARVQGQGQGDGPSQPSGDVKTPLPPSRSSTAFLHTPPISEGSQSRQDRSYFSQGSGRSTNRSLRTTSPDNLATPPCITPGLSSGGSFHSTDTGHSGCSYSSGDYLTPPTFQPDCDKPPYIPRKRSSESLSMIGGLRRAQTIPVKLKRRHRRRHRCRHKTKTDEHHQLSCWGGSDCQLAPTAPVGQRVLCHGHAGHYVPRTTQYGNTDTYGRLVPQAMPGPAPPVVSRRWSSVEIGTHQSGLNLPSNKRPSLSRATTGLFPMSSQSASLKVTAVQLPEVSGQKNTLTHKNLRKQNRGPKFARGTADYDIVRAIRERLTVRKVGSDQSEPRVEPPFSITLRRASGTSATSGKNVIDKDYSGSSDTTTALAEIQDNPRQTESPTAYLITSEDIDSITELIAANLKRKYKSSRATTPSSRNTRSLSNSSRGFIPSNLSAAESSIADTEVPRSDARSRTQTDYLEVRTVKSGSHSLVRTESKKSLHEVIWKGGGASTGSFNSAPSHEEPKSMAMCDTSSEPATSPEISSEGEKAPVKYKGDAFDPNNARASISEWSWRLPHNEAPRIVTSSESESADLTQKTTKSPSTPSRPLIRSVESYSKERVLPRVKPFPRYAASHEQLQDVVSFPPLSTRKTTSEWFSPLPEIELASPLATPPLATSRSLYDLGVDVNVGPSGTATPTAPFTSWVRSAEISRAPSPSIEFKANYSIGSNKATLSRDGGSRRQSLVRFEVDGSRRRSVVRPHPKASSRVSESSKMGSSIGNYSGERRRSSVPRIQRVRTIDNIHKGEHETPPSRWRPPSICPPRLSMSQVSGSPAEAEPGQTEESMFDKVPEILTRLQRSRSSFTDRVSLIEARSPQLPKPDRAGIYGAITGTLRRSIAVPCETDTSEHVCDDCSEYPRSPSVDWIG